MTQNVFTESKISTKSANFFGHIVFEPEQKDFNKEIVISIDGYNYYFIAKVEKYYPINITNKIEFSGLITDIKNQENSSFDYKTYLLSRKIIGEVKNFKIISLEKSNNLQKFLSNTKIELENLIANTLSEPDSSLMNGIIFGSDSGINQDLQQNLKNSGIYHIISVSGFNVGIIFTVIYSLTSKIINRRKSILIALALVVIFTLFIGMHNMPVLRATLTLLFVYIGLYFGRKVNALSALLLASTCILFYYPLYILSLSFLLSTFATVGILLLGKLTFDIFAGNLKELIEEFKTSLSAISSTSFITFLAFKEINLSGLITNFIVLPFIPITMLGGLLIIVIKILNLEFILFLLKIITDTLFKALYAITEFISKNLLITSNNILVIFPIVLFLIIFDYQKFKKIHCTN